MNLLYYQLGTFKTIHNRFENADGGKIINSKIFLQENELHTDTNPFDIFKVRPLLKLKLSWSQEPTNGLVNRPKLYQANETNGLKKDLTVIKDRLSTQKNGTGEAKNSKHFNIFIYNYNIIIIFLNFQIFNNL